MSGSTALGPPPAATPTATLAGSGAFHPAGRARPPLVLLVPAAAAAAVALLPLVYLAVRAGEGGLDAVVQVVARERTARLVLRSLALAAAVTCACAVLGVSLAWLVARTRLPGRRI